MAKAIYINMKTFDSKEEQYFDWWLQELIQGGYIREVIYQPDSYITSPKTTYKVEKKLKTKTKIVEKTLSKERVYTPDYKIFWTEKARGIFFKILDTSKPVKDDTPIFWAAEGSSGAETVIEVKAQFDSNNMTRLASINIDLVTQLYGVRIDMVKVGNKGGNIFAKTFTPAKYLLTDKTGKPRKLYYDPATLKDYVAEREAHVTAI